MSNLKLRPYQQQDVEKLQEFKACANLSRPRTGKTPTSLILSSKWPEGKTLIVCTGSMLYKWQKEYQDWLKQPCEVYTGTPKQRKEALKNWTHGLTITYDTLKEVDHYNYTKDEEGNILEKEYSHTTGAIATIRKSKPRKLIVDEFHRAKGHKTARAKALNLLSKDCEYKIALTGTPAYSTQLDVYNMLHFLWPEQFDTYWNFRQKFVKHHSIWVKGRSGRPEEKLVPDKLNTIGTKLVHKIFDKYAVQHKASDPDVMPWLPKDPIPELIELPMDTTQKKALKDLEEWFETEGEEVIAKNGLDRITKYRQIISEPQILLAVKTLGPKTKWILEYMKEYIDTPTIYFTNSTKHIKILLPLMQKIAPTAFIIGATTKKERFQIEEDFQTGKVKHLICNTQAAQEGLTLDTGECIIFIEQFPPVGSIDQASQRFTATVEEKKDIPKRIIKLILKDTYDEVINTIIDSRQENVNVLNDFKNYIRR